MRFPNLSLAAAVVALLGLSAAGASYFLRADPVQPATAPLAAAPPAPVVVQPAPALQPIDALQTSSAVHDDAVSPDGRLIATAVAPSSSTPSSHTPTAVRW